MDELFTLHPDQLFLRREALDFGYDDADLRDGIRANYLAKVRHGAYVPASVWEAADEVGRHRLASHAVLRSHKSPLALSHVSAAVEHGLRLHRPDLSKIHVICLDKQIARTTHDIVYHRPPRKDAEIEEREDGVVVLNALRAALETAALGTVASGLVVLDGLIDQDLASMDELHAAHERFRGHGSRKLQVTVRLVRPGAESVGESLGRHLCWSQHLPEPHLQFKVYDRNGVLVGRTDFAWPGYGLLGEFDGVTKYLRMRREDETIEEAVVREKNREDLLRELTGWLMVRLIWSDLFRPTQTARRIRDQLDRGRRLVAA
jgi:hypothetical protein